MNKREQALRARELAKLVARDVETEVAEAMLNSLGLRHVMVGHDARMQIRARIEDALADFLWVYLLDATERP